jgi:hypothetical protein
VKVPQERISLLEEISCSQDYRKKSIEYIIVLGGKT